MADPAGLTQIGRISGAHGIKGEVKILLISEDEELFAGLEEVWTKRNDDEAGRHTLVEQVRPQKGLWIARFAGIEDRTQAEAAKGLGLWVPDEWLKPLEEGEYFVHDLIGAEVFDREGVSLGTIDHYFETGQHMVFEVKGGEVEFLFPGTEEVLKEIHASEGRVVIEPLPGLLDLNRKKERS